MKNVNAADIVKIVQEYSPYIKNLCHKYYINGGTPEDLYQEGIIGLLEANEIGKTDLIVNRIRMDMVKKGDMMSIEDVVDILSIDLIGAVPDDENIVISTNQGDPLVGSDALAGRAYMNICKRIMGEEVPLLDLDVKNGFWAKLFKKKN